MNNDRCTTTESYLDCGLPEWLQESINRMKAYWDEYDRTGEKPIRWDLYYCELQSDINVAEVEQIISTKQAWYLRENYLRIEREV